MLGAESLLRMGRTDEAWELMQKATEKKLPDIGDRFKFSHVNRLAIVYLRRGKWKNKTKKRGILRRGKKRGREGGKEKGRRAEEKKLK